MAERDGCAPVAEMLPEVATGAATGDDRARVLRHLAGCAGCRLELEELARTVDDLLPLVPEREPPAGFEAAVLARLAPPAPVTALRPRRRAWRTLAVQVAAAVVAAALAAGLVWWRTSPDRRLAAEYRQTLAIGDGSYLRAAPVTGGAGSVVGHLYAYQGRPSWIYVTVTNAPEPGTYAVRLTAEDGRQWELGECVVHRRYCGAGATISIPVDAISAVRLDQPSGGPGMVAQMH
jgi:Putative zinc-finger